MAFQLQPLTAADLHSLTEVNADPYTETFTPNFYLDYLSLWPSLCTKAVSPDGDIAGYIIGKVEGKGPDWHGHVTALSVAASFRNCGVARLLMRVFEDTCKCVYCCYYSDLFVRVDNEPAVNLYESLGYSTYKRVSNYYSEGGDALDMRKQLQPVTEASLTKA